MSLVYILPGLSLLSVVPVSLPPEPTNFPLFRSLESELKSAHPTRPGVHLQILNINKRIFYADIILQADPNTKASVTRATIDRFELPVPIVTTSGVECQHASQSKQAARSYRRYVKGSKAYLKGKMNRLRSRDAEEKLFGDLNEYISDLRLHTSHCTPLRSRENSV